MEDSSKYTITLYVDGQPAQVENNITANIVPAILCLGKLTGQMYSVFNTADFVGYIAAVRIYAWWGDAVPSDLSNLHL